jgi:crotonobetainyl-CoA:carnitine CoA-transferase CaiB-like acyl-CoA transferase
MDFTDRNILDLTDEKASFCTRLLADLGARVIKIESPGEDPSGKRDAKTNLSLFSPRDLFLEYVNVNKLGITLDLDRPAGREIFRKLLTRHDIVVESFSPGHLARLGLNYDRLVEVNPRLILVSITGFGQDGLRSRYKSCDLVASAYGGQMFVSGSSATPPLKPYGEQSYYTASLYGAISILLAVRQRTCTGKGEHIDISMQEVNLSTLDHVLVRYFSERTVPKRQGALHWNRQFQILPCRDGHILITPFHQWETLVEWLDSEGMAEDLAGEAYRSEAYRLEQYAHILDVLSAWTQRHSPEDLFEQGQLLSFPWAPVYSPRQAANSPQLRDRRFFKSLFFEEINASVRFPGLPFRGGFVGRPYKRAPRKGENNREIFRQVSGLSEKELRSFSLLEHPMREIESGSIKVTENGILKGVRVLDFTWMLAGPFATRVLADFGAEVIKVQSSRIAKGAESNWTPYFANWNRNKRSITLNMGHPEARRLALRLAGICDVVIENFSPRVLANWGLGYETLCRIRPNLILVSMSAMGQTGPWRDFVAYGHTLQALSGLTSLTSFSGESPMGLGYAHVDPIAGLYAVFAILAALEHRENTGKGQYIDLSEYEAVCTLMGPALLRTELSQTECHPGGNHSEFEGSTPYGCYPCKGEDRWCVIAVFHESEWRALCEVMGDPPWTRENRFATPSKRKENEMELNRFLEAWTVLHEAEEIVKLLQEAGIPSGTVQDAEDLARDLHLQARNVFVPLTPHGDGGRMTDASPIRFKHSKAHAVRPPPTLGEDNRSVFIDLIGLTEEEFLSCVERGIIA